MDFVSRHYSQSAVTCSKLTIETLEQGVKYAIGVVLVSLLLTLNIFHLVIVFLLLTLVLFDLETYEIGGCMV